MRVRSASPAATSSRRTAGRPKRRCARREEEVGLDRRHVEIIGRLDTYVTRTGFVVTPVVGLVSPPFTLKPDPHEVAEIFEVPLSFLLDRRNHQRCSAEFEGRTRFFWAMPYGRHFIWGATAGMLVNFCDILDGR